MLFVLIAACLFAVIVAESDKHRRRFGATLGCSKQGCRNQFITGVSSGYATVDSTFVSVKCPLPCNGKSVAYVSLSADQPASYNRVFQAITTGEANTTFQVEYTDAFYVTGVQCVPLIPTV